MDKRTLKKLVNLRLNHDRTDEQMISAIIFLSKDPVEAANWIVKYFAEVLEGKEFDKYFLQK